MPGIGNSTNMRLFVFVYDVALANVAMFAALVLRFGSFDALDINILVRSGLLPFSAAAAVSLITMRTYRTSWRHASTIDLITILYSVSLTVLIFLPLSFISTRLWLIPRTSVILAWMVLFLLMAGSRVGYRLAREGRLFFSRRPMSVGQMPILVIGGGTNAEILLRGLDRSSEYYPVGILDDTQQGASLRGTPILGRIQDAAAVIESFADAGDRPRKLVLVNRDLPTEAINHLVDVANRFGLTVARGPDPTQFRPGAYAAADLQPISVEDLLGRPQIVLDPLPVHNLVAGQRILVTGAGGSIGSEIVRQICAIGPAAICLLDSSEYNLYTIDNEVREKWPEISRSSRIIDVRHQAGVTNCFSLFQPDIVFHAAALKHVPLVEDNPLEGIWTNVVGSRNVCDAAATVKCRALVLISTDKAVNPTNVMGATKRCAESYCQALALAQPSGVATHFVAVRFGNVLGSAGSVVPLFERQLRAGGPLTVTHHDIERYFMTIREAVQLVLQASALGTAQTSMAGRVFVLDMGQPVKIAELARQMIRLAGLEPDKDIAIQFTGLRPGEKLYEELFHHGERIEATLISRINIAAPRTTDYRTLKAVVDDLENACLRGDGGHALSLLGTLVPEYVVTPNPPTVRDAYRDASNADDYAAAVQPS
jgi:O-antigen biosynthesis protein WbqV